MALVYENQVQIHSVWHATENCYAEMEFTALAGGARAMMNMGNVPRGSCYTLFGKVMKTAMKLVSLVIVEINGVKKT